MEKEARLQAIYDMISKSEVPVSGSALSKKFNVSRQVIVQDIALLKEEMFIFMRHTKDMYVHIKEFEEYFLVFI